MSWFFSRNFKVVKFSGRKVYRVIHIAFSAHPVWKDSRSWLRCWMRSVSRIRNARLFWSHQFSRSERQAVNQLLRKKWYLSISGVIKKKSCFCCIFLSFKTFFFPAYLAYIWIRPGYHDEYLHTNIEGKSEGWKGEEKLKNTDF